MTKQAEEHRLPLSDEAVELLSKLKETAPAKQVCVPRRHAL